MNKIILFSLALGLFACGSSSKKTETTESIEEPKTEVQRPDKMPSLEGTKWRFRIAEGAYNYYVFTTTSDYKYISIEMEDIFYGNYEVKNDTLYLRQYISARDSLVSAESPHRSLETKEKWIMTKRKLLLVDSQYKHATGWVTTNISPDVFYERIE